MRYRTLVSVVAAVGLALLAGACQDDARIVQPEDARLSPGPPSPTASADHARVVTVRPNKMEGWILRDDNGTGNGGIALVKGPAKPPKAAGSAEFTLTDANDGWILQTFDERFVGLRLDAVTELRYCTYVAQASGVQAPALQLNFDDDVTDSDKSWKGRLVFEPANNQGQATVKKNQWQCWDADAGRWWSSAGLFGSPRQAIANNKTFSQILTMFPDAGINSKFGGVGIKAGSGWTGGFLGNADAFTVGVDGDETTYDFEGQPAQARGPRR